MVNQYPDTVLITRKPEFAQNASGNYKPAGEESTFTSECRAEPAGDNPVIKGADGNMVEYSWIVFMPKTSEVFAFGDTVQITKADGSIYKGSLKRPSNGQFNTRLWV